MNKKLVVLLLIVLVLIGAAAGYVTGGLQAYSRYQQNSVANQEHCGGQTPVHICVDTPPTIFSAYYPSYVATHTLPFIVKYSSNNPLTLLISVSIQGFSQVETHTVNSSTTIQETGFVPPVLNNQILRRLTTESNTSLAVRVTDTGGHLYYLYDSPLLLHSRWLMRWEASNRLRLAAWVTPGDQAVTQLIGRAEKYLSAQPAPAPAAMIGYTKASPKAVRDQVDAIFDALRLDYHVHYVQASVPYSGPGDTNASLQIIKAPVEVLLQQSGMCVELSLLLASAVEAIGLHAQIIIIPGHAFLGVAVTPDQTQFEYWDAVQVNNGVAGDSANILADNEYAQNVKQLVDKIAVSDARKQGIGPMF